MPHTTALATVEDSNRTEPGRGDRATRVTSSVKLPGLGVRQLRLGAFDSSGRVECGAPVWVSVVHRTTKSYTSKHPQSSLTISEIAPYVLIRALRLSS